MARSLFALLQRKFGPQQDALTRREMLKATLAGASGLLLSNTLGCGDGKQPAKTNGKQAGKGGSKRVLVVGAGFAGLAAAHELVAAGYDVTVLEARSRASGRVLSFDDFVKGKNVEGGGEFIGSNHPTWVSYAERFKLKFLDVTEDEEAEAPIVLKGKRLNSEEAEKLWEEMDEALPLMNADAEKVDADEPWKTADATGLDKRTLAAWIEELKVSELCKAGLTVQMTMDNGAPTAMQSYLGNLAMVKGGGLAKFWTDSESYRCEGGNQQLALKLMEAIGKERVRLGAPVKAIAAGEKSASVTLADGETLEADDVILTAPPSVWDRISFDPALPRELNPQMCTVLKMLLSVKGRFWQKADPKLSPDSLADDLGLTWESTDNQPGDSGAGLSVFSSAAAAETVRQWNKEERVEKYLKLLERMYADIRPQYDGSRFMDWPGEEWTKAGYSFPAPGQVTSQGPKLRQGLGRLQFAGEYASYAFIGYMEGALSSGAAVAKRLATRDGVIK